MTHDDLERRLRAWYEAEIANREAAPATLYASLADIADEAPAPSGRFTTRRYFLLVAAALVLSLLLGGTIAIGSGLIPLPWAVDEAPPPAEALRWTQSSFEEDWPVPIRPEPLRATVVVPTADPELSQYLGRYTDPRGDLGSAAPAWVDIAAVGLSGGGPPMVVGVVWGVDVDLAADIPLPVADPREQWIAYGLVLDTNADGIPDVRLGMDNMPVSEQGHRAWRTELGTGQTMSATGAPYGRVGRRYVDTFFPGESTGNVAEFNVGLTEEDSTFRFYAWASLIEDGRVVATDYAPDIGWLEPAANEDR